MKSTRREAMAAVGVMATLGALPPVETAVAEIAPFIPVPESVAFLYGDMRYAYNFAIAAGDGVTFGLRVGERLISHTCTMEIPDSFKCSANHAVKIGQIGDQVTLAVLNRRERPANFHIVIWVDAKNVK